MYLLTGISFLFQEAFLPLFEHLKCSLEYYVASVLYLTEGTIARLNNKERAIQDALGELEGSASIP